MRGISRKCEIIYLKIYRFGGFNDWRLPTLEEAMSLMEPQKYGELYINPIFNKEQMIIGTVDSENKASVQYDLYWNVSYYAGKCFYGILARVMQCFVRAVRNNI